MIERRDLFRSAAFLSLASCAKVKTESESWPAPGESRYWSFVREQFSIPPGAKSALRHHRSHDPKAPRCH